MKKTIIIFAAFILFVVASLTALGIYYPDLQRFGKKLQEKRLQAEYDRNMKEIEEAYKNDIDGGKTPEETFDLFLVALKADNVEMASKYYELPVQPKALANLQKEFTEKGNLQRSLDYFTEVRQKGEKKCNEDGDGCTFEYVYLTDKDEMVSIKGTDNKIFIEQGDSRSKYFDMTINVKTIVWKISQPY